MADWKKIVDAFYRMTDPDGVYDYHVAVGATNEVIQSLQTDIGIEFPNEFRDLYLRFDGIGLVSRDEMFMPLFLRPIGQIRSYIDECRSVFSETHPDAAVRYFPFIDWSNGDSSGYLINPRQELHPYLYTFSHEDYSYEKCQDVNDFLKPQSETIEGLLSPE